MAAAGCRLSWWLEGDHSKGVVEARPHRAAEASGVWHAATEQLTG